MGCAVRALHHVKDRSGSSVDPVDRSRNTAIQSIGESPMTVARVTEIISSSKKSFEDAVKVGIDRASKTLQNVQGAWIGDQKVVIVKGKVVEYRVQLKVTFILKD